MQLLATLKCDMVATRFYPFWNAYIFNWCYQVVAFPLLACVTGLSQDFSLVKCLLNISDIIVQALNALQGMDINWKEVVGK